MTLLPGASGSTGGEDPWTLVVYPLFEGASLVIVGTGTATTSIYDKGLAGKTFLAGNGLAYTLALPVASKGVSALFDNIGADGQTGSSRTSISTLANEVTTLNGVKIAGPGSAANDSDWNGSSGLPLPQLWDDTGHNIIAEAGAGTTALNFTIRNSGSGYYDCLTPVANVVAVQ